MADTHFIQVRAGRGDPPSLELRPGVELTPLSVGTGGAWQIDAAGVLVVHLYIYFDGHSLFLQSADESDPPRMDGQPVPNSWTEVTRGCTITFGRAELVFRPAGEAADDVPQEDQTVAEAMPEVFRQQTAATQPRPELARPFKPGAFAAQADSESTRLQPLEDFGGSSGDATLVSPLEGGNAAPAHVRPAAGAPWTRAATQPALEAPAPAGGARPFPPAPLAAPEPPPYSEQQRQMGAPTNGPPSGLLNIAPPSVRRPDAPEAFDEKLKRQWREAPPLRKALIGAMPIALAVLAWTMLAGSPPPPPPKNLVSATPSTTPSTPAVPTVAALPTTAPTPWPPLPPPPPPVPPPTTAQPPNNPSTAQPNTAQSAAALPNPSTDAGVNVDRRERQAADFVATHAYDQAIRIYESLALERPQNPAYHEAARILRNKIETNTP